MANQTDKIASRFLGQKVACVDEYDSNLLVAIPRIENRLAYSIDENNLPFYGVDVWHAYEFSVLTNNGLPVTRLIKLKYGADSRYLVESKSLKLYLNSFNMSRFGDSTDECLSICKSIIERDLSDKLECVVSVNFIDVNTNKVDILENFVDILTLIDEKTVTIENFKESPELLEVNFFDSVRENYLSFDSLRSNCRVTHQPDFGDIFIYYKSKKHIIEATLVQYLCSFRSEYHFHEECCEMIFKRLFDLLDNEDELLVCALYTRRGGIDISPVRWKKNTSSVLIDDFIDVLKFSRRTIKQ